MIYTDLSDEWEVDFSHQIERVLFKLNQQEMLTYMHSLPPEKQQKMRKQLESLDLSVFDYQEHRVIPSCISPSFAMHRPIIEENKERLTELGLEALRKRKVAAVMLAGGQGSRLDFDHPKGTYNVGITRELYIFECQIKNLLKVCEQAQRWIPLFIMTSVDNYDETVQFFKDWDYFGYSSAAVYFFKQEQLPVLDGGGKLMLKDEDTILTAPNGNGGWFSSLVKSGLQTVIKELGIEWVNVFAVDNVLQKIADPVFIGAVLEKHWASGAKVVKKLSPEEPVGTLCVEDGFRPTIVEYYELPERMRYAKNPNGEYIYDTGVILNYLFRVDHLENSLGVALPLHRANKKVTYQTFDGEKREDYAFKFETLALDLIRLQPDCLPVEVLREEEFAPIKNKTGENSVETARKLLELNGITL